MFSGCFKNLDEFSISSSKTKTRLRTEESVARQKKTLTIKKADEVGGLRQCGLKVILIVGETGLDRL